MIDCTATGLVYTNPRPYLRSVHAWHPSLVKLGERELLCAFDLGQAAESLDYRTYLSRSIDGGETWSAPERLLPEQPGRPSTHTMRISLLRDGTLAGLGARFYRDDANEGLTNRATMGFVPMDVIYSTSGDGGRTWAEPRTLEPPLVGPAFEICHPVLELADGRLLAPTQTWPDWSGYAPNGMKALAFVSHDGGATWPEYATTFDGTATGVINFEQSVVQMRDGRLLAVSWAYEERTGATLAMPYSISADGVNFSPPQLTGLNAQTAKLLVLDDERVLCVYRREDRPGLWAQVACIDGDLWINLEEILLWEGELGGARASNTSDQLSGLKFGFPSLVRIADDETMVVFWCEEGGLHKIRWFRLITRATSPAASRSSVGSQAL
jgi:hypothetical protein